MRIKIDYKDNYVDDECSKYPELPSIIPKKRRIIVIGDVHGDYKSTVYILKLAKLVDDDMNWVAQPRDTVVVQVGDQIDRCRSENCNDPNATRDDENSDIKILVLFTKLHTKAIKHGGGVYSLLGNHEIMNSQKRFKYVSFKGIAEYGNTFEQGSNGRHDLFKPGGKIGKFMACTRQTAIIVGDFLFVHAGIVPKLIKKYNMKGKNSIISLNTIIRNWLLDKTNGINMQDFLNDPELSPFWPRIYGQIDPNKEKCGEEIDKVFEVLEIKGMIVGHTPQYHNNEFGINETCNKKIWRVDVGVSTAFHGANDQHKKIQVLEILNNQLFNIIKY
jgi:hypothetical protein